MKFQAKLSGFLVGLQPIIVASTTGAQRDYDDACKVSLIVNGNELFAEANNGNVAVNSSLASVNGIDFKAAKDGSVTVKANDLAAMLAGFSSDENVIFEAVGNELTVTPESDAEQKSSMPSESRAVVMPAPAAKFTKEVEVKRETLLNAMNKVLFAVGDEKYRPQFLYWVMRIRNDGFRLAAGDGSRFAVYEIEGANVVKSKDQFNIHVSKEHNAVLQKLLGVGTADSVTIQESGTTQADAQIVVSFDALTLTLIGHDPGIKWPDENKFLNRQNPIKYTTALSDWLPVLKSVAATYNEDVRKQNQIHHCTMQFDSGKGNALVKADHYMKTTRKVKIRDAEGEGDVSFVCLSRYMADVQKYGDAEDRIQMEFLDEKQPLVIRFFAGDKVSKAPLHKDNAANQTREQYVMFIASVNRAQQAAPDPAAKKAIETKAAAVAAATDAAQKVYDKADAE
jgi:DNA polymerase III sliding clamp (beta) subunit (PCNA family)